MGSALIQLYLTPNNCGEDGVIHPDEWPSVSLKDQRSCAGLKLKQATLTNTMVWVNVDQINRVVFCPHLPDCVNQTYAPMGGRDHTYFVQSQVFFDSDAHYSFTSLGINDYSIFSGASSLPSNRQPTVSTFTHRIIQSFHAISRENNKLLTKGSRLASIVPFFMPL
jgi:hypothetical protein